MHSRTVINSLATASVAALLMFVAQVSSAADLVGALTSQLGVSSAQAAGGAGSIFGLAKQNLSVAEFGEIADTVPNMADLLTAAPKESGAMSSLGSLAGGSGGSLGNLATLAGSFEKLGLSQEMVAEFLPIVLDYVNEHGSEHAMELLKKAIS